MNKLNKGKNEHFTISFLATILGVLSNTTFSLESSLLAPQYCRVNLSHRQEALVSCLSLLEVRNELFISYSSR